jgi:hypothetical protein
VHWNRWAGIAVLIATNLTNAPYLDDYGFLFFNGQPIILPFAPTFKTTHDAHHIRLR